jgi:hypothetical protein
MIQFLIPIAFIASVAQERSGAGPEVTVYNQGFGLVKELRHLDLKNGVQSVALSDMPSMIDPTSVAIRSTTQPGSFDVLEQNYQYDLVNVESILNKSVGGRIRLLRHFGGLRETLEGTLMSAPTAVTASPDGGASLQYNGMVLKLTDGHIILNPEGEVEVLTMPEGLISLPTLIWNLNSRRTGDNLVELSFIASGMKWEANYVLTLDSATQMSSLQGWASVNNESGATYKDAKLKLLAGDVHQVAQPPRGAAMDSTAAPAMEKAKSMKEEQLFEYHLYTLQRPATIKDKETKQLSLLESDKVPFKKRLIIDSLQDYGIYYPSDGEVGSGNLKPQVRVEFINNKEAGLGIPLPAGKVRIYQRDASGSVQLLGEDSIEHTPKNEKVTLIVGNSFDIVANRKRLSFRQLGGSHYKEEFEIDVRNRKETSEVVEILERHYGDWSINKTSMPFTKEDATTMRYVVHIKPNEVRKITYTVETKW